ncbi:MAG: hypothetical protein IH991_04980 [Planctomycetes bacterium]|nr:hypothetical protein [Planctomycetota bacterium]
MRSLCALILIAWLSSSDAALQAKDKPVRCVVHAPGRIPAGRTIDSITTIMDLYPTLAGLAGAQVSPSQVLDGKNIWPLLSGESGAAPVRNEFFYFVRHGVLAGIRQDRWKLLKQNGKVERYDLEADIEESKNLAKSRPQIVKRLAVRMQQFESNIEATKRKSGGKNSGHYNGDS